MKKQWKVSHSQKSGQISILLALIFPVLFVFFAMTINIGLVVHDKINLQTSADLAAYYAAQKQAEVLNAIAHLNYQIRQHWKLLSFRIRGFGSVGLGNPSASPPQPDHPFKSLNAASEDPFWGEVPTVCTQVASFWAEQSFKGVVYPPTLPGQKPSNSCDEQEATIRGVQPPLALGFNTGLNELVQIRALEQLDQQEISCRLHGTTNWIVATTWLKAYIKALYHRKKAIKELAEKLRDGLDLHNNFIEAGALETFRSNLTRSNREAFDDDNDDDKFDLFNSMEGFEWSEWLVERPLYTVVYYTDFEWVGSTLSSGLRSGNCIYEPKQHFNPPVHKDIYDNPSRPTIERLIRSLEYYTQQTAGVSAADTEPPDLNLNTIIGYEKNPWYMVYSGVYVKTSPKEPFSPFVGSNVLTMTAKAFAKPFGGKIGPWMYESWPSGENKSAGGERIDKTLPPIRDDDGNFTFPDPNNILVGTASPNYARYPGDEFGLKSFAALRVYKDSLIPAEKLYHQYFIDGEDFFAPKYDPLVLRDSANPFIETRLMEIMAVSPDLFDITYYSIDPRFYKNHADISTEDLEFRRTTLDIGGNSNIGYPSNIFGVFDQWAWANNPGAAVEMPLPGIISSSYTPVGRVAAAKWFVKDWKHLLTGWVPNIDEQFGKCSTEGDLTLLPAESLPGSCGIGGRMGYSVKLVSRRYLTDDLRLGNDGSSGQIVKRPPF